MGAWKDQFGGRWGRKGDGYEEAPIPEQLGEDTNRIGDLLAEYEGLWREYAEAKDEAMIGSYGSGVDVDTRDIQAHRAAVAVLGERWERALALKTEIGAVRARSEIASAWAMVESTVTLSRVGAIRAQG